MNVEKELKQLLLKHECVIVPGFGAFITFYESAQIYPRQNQFLPPSKKVSFNRLLTTNDGLLVATLAQKNNLSYQVALQKVESQVKLWNATLENQQVLVINELGKLQQNKEAKIEFIENLSSNMAIQSYGLRTMQHLPIDRLNDHSKVESIESNFKSKAIPVKKQVEKRRKINRKKTPVYVFLASILAIIGLTQLLIFTESPIKVNEANFINVWSSPSTTNTSTHHLKYRPINEMETLSKVDINSRLQNQICATVKIENTKSNNTAVLTPIVKTDNSPQSGYYLILGCFKEQKNADKLANKIAADGKQVYKKVNANGTTTIGEFVSASAIEATQILKQRQASQADVWLKKI